MYTFISLSIKRVSVLYKMICILDAEWDTLLSCTTHIPTQWKIECCYGYFAKETNHYTDEGQNINSPYYITFIRWHCFSIIFVSENKRGVSTLGDSRSDPINFPVIWKQTYSKFSFCKYLNPVIQDSWNSIFSLFQLYISLFC